LLSYFPSTKNLLGRCDNWYEKTGGTGERLSPGRLVRFRFGPLPLHADAGSADPYFVSTAASRVGGSAVRASLETSRSRVLDLVITHRAHHPPMPLAAPVITATLPENSIEAPDDVLLRCNT